MKIKRRRLGLAAAAAFVLSLTMCATTTGGQPGTYRGTAQGNNGPVTVEVVLGNEGITSVTVVQHAETPGISDNALALIPKQIVETQSLAVDTVSGASNSSKAIIEATADALKQAGANLSALSKGAKAAKASKSKALTMAPGTYTGEAYGKWVKDSNEGARFGSPKVIRPITVDVTVDAAKILDVQVRICDDTPGFKEAAIERLQKSIVEEQSIGVDVVTGCTMTSNGILSAVSKALEQAGANLLLLNKKPARKTGTEEYEADVAVVGAGASGSAAALAAVEKGAKVVILEKTGRVSGMGSCSTGFIGVGSKFAVSKGSTATVDEVFLEMMEYTNWTADPLIVKRILEKSGDTADWLMAHGYKYGRVNGFTHDTGKGSAKVQQLYDNYIVPGGGKLLLETRAQDLIVENGKIAGVRGVKQDGTKVIVRAKAVVIATGGFGGNKEMLEEYTGSSKYWLSGLSSSSGDGIKMALSAGAALSDEIHPHITEFAASSVLDFNDSFMKYMNYGGLLQVDRAGKRFMNEELCATQPLAKGASAIRTAGSFFVILDQPTLDLLEKEGLAGLVGPEKTKELVKSINWRTRAIIPMQTIKAEMDEALEAKVAFRADSVEGLEAAAGFRKGTFVSTVNRYNAMAAKGRDDEFKKNAVWLRPIGPGPYYAIRMEPAIFGSMGGIRIDDDMEALNKDRNPIPGLYAVGMDAGGMYGYPYYEIPGVTQGFAYNSGRIAGENASSFVGK